jgi:hypothetical protein
MALDKKVISAISFFGDTKVWQFRYLKDKRQQKSNIVKALKLLQDILMQ